MARAEACRHPSVLMDRAFKFYSLESSRRVCSFDMCTLVLDHTRYVPI